MKTKLALILLLSVFGFFSAESQTRIDLAANKQCLKRIVHWNDKGLIFMLQGEKETSLYFVNPTGAIGWKHSIPNTEYPYNYGTCVFEVNSKHIYLTAFINTKEYAQIYIYMTDESGQFTFKQQKFDHYSGEFISVTEEGVTFVMRDLGRKEMSREFRMVTFSDLTGEQTSSTDLELPTGTWQPYGTFQNKIVVKGDAGFTDDKIKLQRDTFCFLEPSGRLFNLTPIDVDYKQYEFVSGNTYYFDDEEKCIYVLNQTVKTGEKNYSGFQINKYDPNGKLLESWHKWFDDLAALDPEFEKKSLYKFVDIRYFKVNHAWGGICFEFEKSSDPKDMHGVVVSLSGEVRQTIHTDYFFINQKYYNEVNRPFTAESHCIDLNEYPTMFTINAKPSTFENGEPLNKISKINANEKLTKPNKAFYSYDKIGGENLILEYFPKEAYMQIYH